MLLMEIIKILLYTIVITVREGETLTVGGRFTRESNDNGINLISPTNFSQIEPKNNTNNTTLPAISVVGPILQAGAPSSSNDSEADNFIESLKKQAEGIEPKNKNETHIINSEADPLNNNVVSQTTAPNIDTNVKNVSTTTETHGPMLLNENATIPTSNESVIIKNVDNMTTPSNDQKMNNGTCSSDCSADSCKPGCSFHCCLQQKESLEKVSLGKYYQQDANGVNTGFEFNSAKLEKMLLDTISEFSQKAQAPSQQPQKLSDIMLDPSKHYQYAPNLDSNNNNFNSLHQFPSQYLTDTITYPNNKYPSNVYPNSYNTPTNFGFPSNQQVAQKSQINPTYPYKRNNINYPKTPVASGYRKMPYIPRNYIVHPNYGYNSRNFLPRQNKIIKRNRIYSPYMSPTNV